MSFNTKSLQIVSETGQPACFCGGRSQLGRRLLVGNISIILGLTNNDLSEAGTGMKHWKSAWSADHLKLTRSTVLCSLLFTALLAPLLETNQLHPTRFPCAFPGFLPPTNLTMISAISLSLLVAASAPFVSAAAVPQPIVSRAPPVPAPAPGIVPVGTPLGEYTSIGCYQDTRDRSRQILTKYEFSNTMTLDKCAALARQGKYTYFGVSNGQWCYFDNQINYYNGLGYATTDDKCAVPCGGNSAQNCGSFWTNTMFQLTSTLGPVAPWTVASSACTAEVDGGRALIGASTVAADMTPAKCTTFCASKGFVIAGVEYGTECYCGNSLVNGASLTKTSTQCNKACGGEIGQNCGGPGALKLFVLPSVATTLNSDLTSKAAALPVGWSAASTACVAEGSTGRALTGAATAAKDMTPAKCATFCADQGFKYAGVEYGSECYCGSTLVNGASLDKSSQSCNMACSGSASTICGGPGALNLFTNPSILPSVVVDNTPKGPTVSGPLPAGWSAASTQCIKEATSGRALTGWSVSDSKMTIATCLSACQQRGFQYAGLEYGSECYCGSSLSNGASLSASSDACTMPCANDAASTCGGSGALQLFVNPALAPVIPPATVINGYTASGCIQEVSGRALTGLRVDDEKMTLEICIASCAAVGFRYAGVEYGVECYCGSTLVNGASTTLTSGQCYMNCPGNAAQKCGGPNAIQLFVA